MIRKANLRGKLSRWLAFVVLCATVLLPTGLVEAQPVQLRYVTLEAMMARSYAVFRGTITNFSSTPISRPELGNFRYQLTLRVDDWLTGPAGKEMAVTGEATRDECEALKQCAVEHTSLLCMVTGSMAAHPGNPKAQSSGPSWTAIRLEPAVAADLQRKGRPFLDGPVYLSDSSFGSNAPSLTHLAIVGNSGFVDPHWPVLSGDQILARARAFAAERPIATNTCWLGDIEVPVTSDLETVAWNLMQKTNHLQSRVEGVTALRSFKSRDNIQLLQSLLNDADYREEIRTAEPWFSRRFFDVREAAWDTLEQWAVNVPKPVTAEDLPWRCDPAIRHALKVQMPTALSVTPLGPTGDNLGVSSGNLTNEWTHFLAGSNMIVGVRSEWFVYAEGQLRPAKPTRVQQDQTPSLPFEYFSRDRGHALVAGQKYVIELNYALFETDSRPVNPNEDDESMEKWQPQEGKNYRILTERKLKGTFGPYMSRN